MAEGSRGFRKVKKVQECLRKVEDGSRNDKKVEVFKMAFKYAESIDWFQDGLRKFKKVQDI